MALRILVLAHQSEKGLYQPGTDECQWMVQHSSNVGLINMQWCQLQDSSQ